MGLFLDSLFCFVDPFLCHYHAVLITVALCTTVWSLGSLYLQVFFFFMIALPILDLCVILYKFQDYSSSVKTHEYFDKDCIKSVDCFV